MRICCVPDSDKENNIRPTLLDDGGTRQDRAPRIHGPGARGRGGPHCKDLCPLLNAAPQLVTAALIPSVLRTSAAPGAGMRG